MKDDVGVTNDRRTRSIVASFLLLPLPLIAGIRVAAEGEPHQAVLREHSTAQWSAGPPIVRRMVLGHSTQGRPDHRVPPRGSHERDEDPCRGVHPRERMRGDRDRPRADRHAADRHRPVGDPQPEPRRVPRRHASERSRRGSEPELPVPLAPDRTAVGQGVLRTPSALRARGPDRPAPDRARASRREHLVPPTARARGPVGGRHHDPAAIRSARRTPAGQARRAAIRAA